MSTSERDSLDLLLRLAHDIRNPLAVVLANLRFLVDEVKQSDLNEALMESHLSTMRANRMIEDMLDAERFRIGKRQVSPTRLSLEDVAREVQDAVIPLVGRRVLEILLPAIQIFTDRDLLVRALINLLEHGLRQSPSGKKVSLAATLDDGLLLRVTDAGPPFDPATTPSFLAPHIHQRVLPSSAYRSDQGLGLFFAGQALRALGAQLDMVGIQEQEDIAGVRFNIFFAPEYLIKTGS